MKIIITGGTGLIGTALRKSFLENSHEVVIISRNPDLTSGSAKIISWDINTIVHELSDTDVVINLAGASISGSNPLRMRWTPKRKKQILSSRVEAGKLITEAIRISAYKPGVLIQASAIGYYGNSGSGPIDETSIPGSDFLADVCQDWEKSTGPVENLGVRRVITRIGLVFSKDGGLLPFLSLPFRFFMGGAIGSGNQTLSWIHIYDVVHAIKFLIEQPQTQGVYNLTAPNPVSNQIFAQSLGQTLNKPVWLPVPALLLTLGLGEAATLALDGKGVLPKRLLEAGYQFKYPDLQAGLENSIKKH
ncbi:MAG: TIGR01777 family oxidoreductase [Anaerolineales bacterium]|nr:TIGR01777 family oxidoreductase [Anaerolineales bacterium]